VTADLFGVCWALERGIQLLQKLSLSQSVEIQRLINKLFEVAK